MLVLLANKYTLLITPTQVKLIYGIDIFQTSHYLSKIDFNGNDIANLDQAIQQSLEKVKDNRAKIYVRVSYPFIKTDILPATNSYLNHKENQLRARHLFDKNYGESTLDAVFRVDESQFRKQSIAECMSSNVFQLVKRKLDQNRFKLTEITSVHSWIINSLKDNMLTGGVVFCQNDVYTYSLIVENTVSYVVQFQCQLEHLAKAVLHQIRKSLLICPLSLETLRVYFLTDALSSDTINFGFDTLHIPECGLEIHHRVGML